MTKRRGFVLLTNEEIEKDEELKLARFEWSGKPRSINDPELQAEIKDYKEKTKGMVVAYRPLPLGSDPQIDPTFHFGKHRYRRARQALGLEALRNLVYRYPGLIRLVVYSNNQESIVYTSSPKSLEMLIHFLYYDYESPFTYLVDIFAVDNPSRNLRFSVSYIVRSLRSGVTLTIRVGVTPYQSLPTLSRTFDSANWLEREVWDMFGIPFIRHFDLRRILTDYGFIGHPLRKDFPLAGFFELRYNDIFRRVGAEPLNFKQEMRFYFFNDNPFNWDRDGWSYS